MTNRTLQLLLGLILIAMLSMSVSAQEENDENEELPVIPYVTTSGTIEQFNIPIPDGWVNVGTGELPHLVVDGVEADIYVVAIGSNELEPGLLAGVRQIIPDFDAEARTVGELNLDGDIWTQTVFDLENQNVTAFSLLRSSVVYSLIYVNSEPTSNFYMVATRPDEPGVAAGINEAMAQIYPDFSGAPIDSREVELSNGTWLRQNYDVDGQPVSVLGQLRGNTTFVVIEEGDANKIETVNKAFYTVLFGFFVTPDSVSYLYLGLAAVFVFAGVLIISMFARYRNVLKDTELIHRLAQEG